MSDKPVYITEKEFSRRTSIPVQTLRNLRASAKGPPFFSPADLRIVRYREDDVKKYLRDQS